MDAPPGRLTEFHGVELHAGADLDQSFNESAGVCGTGGAVGARIRLPMTNRLATRLLNIQWSSLWPRACSVRGIERLSGTEMHILFRGRLLAVDFVARHLLDTQEFERQPAYQSGQHDIVVDDQAISRRTAASLPAIQVPAWVRQSRQLGSSWAETLTQMSSSLRKRISGQLAKRAYTVRIDSSESAKLGFYRELYLPFAHHRFGREAVVLTQSAFLRYARGSALLELWSGGVRVGATVLHDSHDTLYIGKAGFSLDDESSYRSDLLDYFCFLTAQLLGSRTLDFGLSRPHIEDGVLLNKAKWGTRLESAGGLPKTIRITPITRSDATLAFLSRNGFIERRAGRFVVRRLRWSAVRHDERHADRFSRLDKLAARSGLDALILACAGEAEVAAINADLTPLAETCRIAGDADPVDEFLRRA